MVLFGSGKRLGALNRGRAPAMYGEPGAGGGVGVLAADPPALVAGGADRAQDARSIRQALPPMTQSPRRDTGISPPSEPDTQARPLGGSMRQGFDYDAAMSRLVGEKPRQSGLAIAAAILGDALTTHAGGRPFAVQNLLAQRQGYQDRLADAQRTLTGWQYRDFARQNEADLAASAPFTIGRDRVQFNPATGQAGVLYDGAEDFELYASELGLEPGTDPYFRAVEDYVLRSSGPSAHSRDRELDDHRTANDERLEGLRFGNRQRMEQMRQGNRIEAIRSRPAPAGKAPQSKGGVSADGLPLVSSPAEAARLPKGTRFRTPDGRVKVVP